MQQAAIAAEGLYFGECPRWHDGKLWFSDFFDRAVWTLDAHGALERVVEVPGQPAGLGWTPGGELLVVSMLDRCVMKVVDGVLEQYADLWEVAAFHANDMLVDGDGRAWVGNYGFDVYDRIAENGLGSLVEPPGPPTAALARVDPDGSVHVAADDLVFPNGMVITPDKRTFIIAETLAMRLTAFDLAEDGTLSGRRTWAELNTVYCAPDGLSLDAEGMIWVANAIGPGCLRVAEGGKVVDEVRAKDLCFACMLGGPEGRTLYMMCSPESVAHMREATKSGRIFTAEVDVPKAGWP